MAHILVVDDEESIRDPLTGHLESLGHRCTQAVSGFDALERLQEREYDLIISYVMMPKMDGFQLLKRALPCIETCIPFVILSSIDDQEGVRAAIFAGAFDYLYKPSDPDDVDRGVTRALERREELLAQAGPYRSRKKGPIPADALGADPNEAQMTEENVPPSGVPALKHESAVVTVVAPSAPKAPAIDLDDEPAKKGG